MGHVLFYATAYQEAIFIINIGRNVKFRTYIKTALNNDQLKGMYHTNSAWSEQISGCLAAHHALFFVTNSC
jgi:hypothetical protein